MNTAQRRQAVLNAFDKHEEMTFLLACLARSPALWEEDEDEAEEVKGRLAKKGFLKWEAGFYTTTTEGREALIEYVCGVDEDDDDGKPEVTLNWPGEF